MFKTNHESRKTGIIPEVNTHDIFDNAPIGIFTSTPNGRITSANATLAKIFRYKSPKKMIQSVKDIATQLYADSANREEFKSLLEKNDKITNHETKFRCKDGTELWGSMNANTIRDEDGQLIAYQGFISDITEQKKAEKALQESETRFRGMLGVVPDMISIHSPEMEILYSNWQGFAAVPEKKRVPNTKCHKTYRDFDDICPDCIAKTVLETGKPMRKETQLPDGTWADLRVIPLLDKNNKVEMFMEWVRDITVSKQNQEALRENKENLRTTLKSIGDAVISTDMDGLMAAMNPVAESLTGWSEKEATGKPLETIFKIINEKTRKPAESPVACILKTGNIVGLTNHTLLIARDGKEIPISDSGAPIRNDAGDITGVVLVFRDQTEERAIRKALEDSEAHYHQLFDNMTSAFAVHEMIYDEQNNPIDYRFIQVNAGFEDIVGIPAEKAIGHTVKELLPATEEYWIKTYAQVVATGKPIKFEHYSQALDKHFEVRAFRPVPHEFAVVFSDITEIKQAKEKLERQYRLLKIAGETAKFGGWDVDLKTYISTWSDTVADIHEVPHGYAPPVDDGMNFYAPEWRKKISQVFTDCAEKGIPYDEEMEIITAKGKRLWVRTIGRALKDGNGSIIKVHGSFQDITERKHAEEALQENKELLDNTGRIAKIGGWELYPETMTVTWTDETYRIHEIPKNVKPLLEDAINFWHPDDRPILRKAIQDALENGTPYDLELRFITAKGKHLYALTKCDPVLQNGKVVKLQGFFQDITERKLIELKIKEQKDLLEAIYRNSPLIMMVVNGERRIQQVNGFATQFANRDAEEMLWMILKVADSASFVNNVSYAIRYWTH